MQSEQEFLQNVWTELQCLQLNTELDSFLDGFQGTPYEDVWPDNRSQEQVDNHPRFMKPPQACDDPEGKTSEAFALIFKKDGNLFVKRKMFHMAIYSYTEGLLMCENPEVQSVLYNNRSAAHFFLKNFRSALADAQRALQYNPDYRKARWRAAQCAFQLERFELCTLLCKEIINSDVDVISAQELLKKNKLRKLEKDRNERKESAEKMKEAERNNRLFNALQERNVKFAFQKPGKVNITVELLKPMWGDYPVHFDKDNRTLLWPVVFFYPEFLCKNVIQELPEEATISQVVKVLFSLPRRLVSHSYRPDTVNVYYANPNDARLHKIEMQKSIRNIVQEEGFFIIGGSLVLFIVSKNSRGEEELFLGDFF